MRPAKSCVELALGPLTKIRDSKSPAGPVLEAGYGPFLAAIESQRFDG
jgi:hypothetical protein